ncbi:MAG: RNA-binding domain-containing protein [Methanomassiliicoccales archaeon]
MLLVTVTTPLYPTEDRGKVLSALRAIFPEGSVEADASTIRITSDSLDNYSELVRKQRILDTARAALRRFMAGGKTSFRLNKQAATAGSISFEEGRQPLGAITVSVEADDEAALDAFIDKVTPRTEHGEPIA